MTAWLIVVLLMVVFLSTMLADPARGAGPESSSQVEQIRGTAVIGQPVMTDN
jgi:hypothetical protein